MKWLKQPSIYVPYAKKADFKTYATIRIRGAILDELRRKDWVPRLTRIRAREIERKRRELKARLGREPNDFEFSEELGVSPFDLADSLKSARPRTINFFDYYRVDEDSEEWGGDESRDDFLEDRRQDNDPGSQLRKREFVRIVREVLGRDSPAYRVIYLYYFKHKLLEEIAEILDLTESRVCQIKNQALRLLKRGASWARRRTDLERASTPFGPGDKSPGPCLFLSISFSHDQFLPKTSFLP